MGPQNTLSNNKTGDAKGTSNTYYTAQWIEALFGGLQQSVLFLCEPTPTRDNV
jgi:hypothetical protein